MYKSERERERGISFMKESGREREKEKEREGERGISFMKQKNKK